MPKDYDNDSIILICGPPDLKESMK